MKRGQAQGGRRRKSGFRRLLGFCLAIGVVAGAWGAYHKLMPSREYMKPEYAHAHPLFYGGMDLKEGALIEQGQTLLPLEAIKAVLGSDLPVWYEEKTQSIILTSDTKVLFMKKDQLQAKLGDKPFQLAVAPVERDGRIYMPLSPLKTLYGIQAQTSPSSGVMTLERAGDRMRMAVPAEDEEIAVRSEPSIHSPYVELAGPGQTLIVWDEQEDWYKVQGPEGHSGYVRQKELRFSEDRVIAPLAEAEPALPWKAGQKVNLTWEAVYNKPPDPSGYPAMEGVNVVSPTWFEVSDGSGQIRSKADASYAAWARQRGMQVWALFSNAFDPDLTTKVLSSVETRFTMIRQLLAYAEMYKLQGINIDFENVRTSDKQNFVQFVRELSPMLHEAGLIVSIDVTPKSNSEMWSLFLDREALIGSVDYMMLMAYDEHWASSPKAGSVASLPWVENSIQRLLEEDGVDPAKLVLSMPLYTRIWSESKGEDGSIDVSSKAVGMERIEEIVRNRKLTPVFDEAAGQNYIEYVEKEGVLSRIWIEDARSIEARVALVHKYGLAGVATWARSFQTDRIWGVIHESLSDPS